jgi:hypothetical protein
MGFPLSMNGLFDQKLLQPPLLTCDHGQYQPEKARKRQGHGNFWIDRGPDVLSAIPCSLSP